MSCGTPVITSNVSSLPEITGDAALLIDPRNEEELTNSMERLLNDKGLQKDLIEKGFLRAKNFTIENAANDILEVIK